MANIRFTSQNYLRTADVTMSNVGVGSTPSYLRDLIVGRIARSATQPGSVSVTYVADFGAPRTVNHWALLAHNISNAGTIIVQFSNTENFGVLLLNAVAAVALFPQPSSPVLYSYLQTPVSARYALTTVHDYNNPDQWIEAGEWVVGRYEEVDWNATFPLREHTYGQNVVNRTEAGVPWSYHWTMRRDFEMSFGVLNDTTREQLEWFVQQVRGSHEPFLIHLNADKPFEPLRWVRLDSRMSISKVSGALWQTETLVFTEEPMPLRLS